MWQSFTDWIKQPFSAEQDTFHWFLFLGLILVIVIFWKIILAHIIDGLGE